MAAEQRDSSVGVYGISVTAELVGTGVQNLRAYERQGLVTPDRTDGGTRRYSDDDVERLRRIATLLADGLNLAGVARVLELEVANAELQDRIDALTDPRPRGRSRQNPARR